MAAPPSARDHFPPWALAIGVMARRSPRGPRDGGIGHLRLARTRPRVLHRPLQRDGDRGRPPGAPYFVESPVTTQLQAAQQISPTTTSGSWLFYARSLRLLLQTTWHSFVCCFCATSSTWPFDGAVAASKRSLFRDIVRSRISLLVALPFSSSRRNPRSPPLAHGGSSLSCR